MGTPKTVEAVPPEVVRDSLLESSSRPREVLADVVGTTNLPQVRPLPSLLERLSHPRPLPREITPGTPVLIRPSGSVVVN